MSDVMKKLKGLELPDELLEAVSGGVSDNIEECKELLRNQLEWFSQEELEDLRVKTTELWDALSERDKAAIYADEYLRLVYETYMGRPLR